MRLPAEGLWLPQRKESSTIMRTIKIALLVLAIALALFMIFPNLSWAAEDGASLDKAKCTAYHGVAGRDKSAAQILALNTLEFAKKDAAQVAGTAILDRKPESNLLSLGPNHLLALCHN